MELQYDEAECSGRPAARYWYGTTSACLGNYWVGWVRSRSGGDAVRRSGIFNRIREQQSKSVLEVDNSSGNSQRTLPKTVVTDGD